MDKENIGSLVLLLLAIVICVFFLTFFNLSSTNNTKNASTNQVFDSNTIPNSSEGKDISNSNQIEENFDCNITKILETVDGFSMEPLIRNGDNITLLKNYYDCNDIQRGDIVAYDYAGEENPIVKKIMAIGGDNIEIQNGTLVINGKTLVNSANQTYVFDQYEVNMLSLYIKNGKLISNAYFIFGDNTQNSIDSRKFGAIGKVDILGKFDIEN